MFMKRFFTKEKGMTMLPLVLVVGTVMIEFGIALTFVIYMSNLSSYGNRLSEEAFLAARSGVNDAILKLIRDKDFSTTGYSLTVGIRGSSMVVVENGQPNSDQARITSTGTVLTRQKKIQAIVSIDSNTSLINLVSMEEI